ncbi:MAG TPA: FAD-dependent oxidoreductase [Desulfobacteria bacterium]|nr:FAD-dependent oxidoreductase [Desulfobacteria bacterium]
MKIVIVGSGWAGCSAAYFAAREGAQVILLEKTDLLLGTGLVGGIMNNNGRRTASLEAAALGIGELFGVIESVTRHDNIDFPGHKHASLYDVERIEAAIKKFLNEAGVEIVFKALVNNADVTDSTINSVSYEIKDNSGTNITVKVDGDVFIDTTGTAGPVGNCTKYGTGCAMCILRCPSFGPRISLAGLAGVSELKAKDGSRGFEAMSGSCKIDKRSLKKTLVKKLEEAGRLVIPLPEEFRKKDSLSKKACQQYAIEEFADNLIILDTGQAKLMTPYFPIENLRQIEGFREAKYADPYSGGKGNSVRFMAMSPCDGTMKVKGIHNLFCAGEKVGPIVGHTEAIITGALAGINAVRAAKGRQLHSLPSELAVGDIIEFMHGQIESGEGIKNKYSFSGSVYFSRMLEKDLYSTDKEVIEKRIKVLGITRLLSN